MDLHSIIFETLNSLRLTAQPKIKETPSLELPSTDLSNKIFAIQLLNLIRFFRLLLHFFTSFFALLWFFIFFFFPWLQLLLSFCFLFLALFLFILVFVFLFYVLVFFLFFLSLSVFLFLSLFCSLFFRLTSSFNLLVYYPNFKEIYLKLKNIFLIYCKKIDSTLIEMNAHIDQVQKTEKKKKQRKRRRKNLEVERRKNHIFSLLVFLLFFLNFFRLITMEKNP